MELDELVNRLIALIRADKLDWNFSTAWTKKIKDYLRDMFESQADAVQVSYSDGADRHEFMLDVVAWDKSGHETVTLAVECEWYQKIEEVENDFRKLLVVKSPLKLMIFACNKKARKFRAEDIQEMVKERLRSYRDHVRGERYVFINFAPFPDEKAWWIEVPEDGKMEKVPDPIYIQIR